MCGITIFLISWKPVFCIHMLYLKACHCLMPVRLVPSKILVEEAISHTVTQLDVALIMPVYGVQIFSSFLPIFASAWKFLLRRHGGDGRRCKPACMLRRSRLPGKMCQN